MKEERRNKLLFGVVAGAAAVAAALILSTPVSQAQQGVMGVTRQIVTNIVQALISSGGTVASNIVNIVTFQTNVVFNGKVTLNSNVFISQLSFATNAGAVNVLNLNCTDQFISTNNNVSFTGFSIPAEYGVTNSAWATVLITNNSALAQIMLSFPGCIGDTNVFVTNQAAFTVKKYPGAGTNVVFNSLK